MKDMRKNRKLVMGLKDELNKRHSKMISLAEVGSHLYGWETIDSDLDLRGIHTINTFELFRLSNPEEVIEKNTDIYDFVSFEIKKAMNLLVKNNFNLIEDTLTEQIHTYPYYLDLKELIAESLTKKIAHGYKGCATFNYKKFIASENTTYRNKAIKKYLYVFRSLMAGIYILENEVVEPNIRKLNKSFCIPIIDSLLYKKERGEILTDDEKESADDEINKLYKWIDEAYISTSLPDNVSDDVKEKYEKLLRKIRKEEMNI